MVKRIDRRTFVKTAAAGSMAAAALPLFGTSVALGDDKDEGGGHRIFVFVSFSQAPAMPSVAEPRIGMTGAGTFKPAARHVNGGGSYVLSDNAVATPRPLIASGRWMARQFVSYDTMGFPRTGRFSPASW